MDLEQIVYSLPSTRTFIDETVGGNVGATIVLLPDNLSREMVGRLIRNQLSTMRLSIKELFDPGDTSPAIASGEAMGVIWASDSTRRSIGNLLLSADLPDFFYLHRLPTGNPAHRMQWMQFIKEWARESYRLRGLGHAGSPSLCVIAKLKDFDFQVPVAEPGLKVRWWWGFPSALEVRLACRIASQRAGADLETADRWREYVLPGLVASDVQLGEYMWHRVTEDTDRVVRALVDYWEDHSETGAVDSIDEVIELVKFDNGDYEIGQELPSPLRRLWASGGLVYTTEYGLEVHPGLLAHKGRHGDVRHMLWRGQSQLLLPVLNEIRLNICAEMTTTYGRDWPVRWWKPPTEYELREVEQNPLGAEFGHIDYLLQHVGVGASTHPLDGKRHLAQLVWRAKSIRNRIAHYSPVLFDEFTRICVERNSVDI